MKCIFDNNLPPRLARALNELEGPHGIEVVHLREILPENTDDITWMKHFSKESDCFVITKDRNIRKNPHEVKAWQESGLRIVFLQKSWFNHELWEISWRMIKRWQDLIKAVKRMKRNQTIILPLTGKIENINQ
jgi:predicted nuclease of predicted toxin-antitoxin system